MGLQHERVSEASRTCSDQRPCSATGAHGEAGGPHTWVQPNSHHLAYAQVGVLLTKLQALFKRGGSPTAALDQLHCCGQTGFWVAHLRQVHNKADPREGGWDLQILANENTIFIGANKTQSPITQGPGCPGVGTQRTGKHQPVGGGGRHRGWNCLAKALQLTG